MSAGGAFMRIIVISDSHGKKREIEEILEIHKRAKDIIFLGDGLGDLEDFEYIYPDRTFYKVAGNCDWRSFEKTSQLITLGGKRIFFTHGHVYNVKLTYEEIKRAARENHADVCLFGHTHVQYTEYDDGMYIMNPGSVNPSGSGRGCYGIVDITPAGIVTIPASL